MDSTGETQVFEAPSPGAESSGVTEAPSPGADAGVTQESSPDFINGDDPSQHRESLLDAITGAVESPDNEPDEDLLDLSADPSSETDPASETAGAETQEAGAPAQPETETDGDDFPDDHADMPAGFRERLKKLQSQRDEARTQAASLEGVARQMAPVTEFIQKHQLSGDAVSRGLAMMAAWRYGDMPSFLKAAMPLVQQAQQSLGHTLPGDLQQQVQQGLITLDTAKELSQARVASATSQAQVQALQKQQEQQAAQTRANGIVNAISAWEATQRSSDPDYARKEELVRHYSREIIAEQGHPGSPEQAVAVATEALSRSNKYLAQLTKGMQPAAREIRQGPSSAASVTQPVNARPTNLMEAAMSGLRQANSGSL